MNKQDNDGTKKRRNITEICNECCQPMTKARQCRHIMKYDPVVLFKGQLMELEIARYKGK
jgi:hypothetical protein